MRRVFSSSRTASSMKVVSGGPASPVKKRGLTKTGKYRHFLQTTKVTVFSNPRYVSCTTPEIKTYLVANAERAQLRVANNPSELSTPECSDKMVNGLKHFLQITFGQIFTIYGLQCQLIF